MRIFLGCSLFLFSCRSEKGVTVFNPNPDVVITSHEEGAEVMEGREVLFIGNVSDPNHDASQLLVSWMYGNDTICGPEEPSEDGTTSCRISMGTETKITLEAKDPENARGADSRTVVLIPSEPPVAQIVRPEPVGVFYSDQKVALEGIVSDAEDEADTLLVHWESDIDGVLNVANIPDSLGNVVGASYLSEGEHFLLLQVEDSSGKIGFDDVTIVVGPPNSTPECSILAPQDGSSGGTGELISLLGTASDADVPASMLTASWSSSIDGVLGSAMVNSDGSILFPYANLSSGTHVLTLSVADERDALCTDSILYTVGTPPVVSILSPNPSEVINEGDIVTFVVSVSDAQDAPTDIDLLWTLNGQTYSTQKALSDGMATRQDMSLVAGSYTLQVVATDGEELSSSALRDFVVNGLPSAPEVSISPQQPTTANDLNAVIDVSSVDPEGDPITYSYEWFRNGISQGIGSSTQAATQTAAGDVWSVQVMPSDSWGMGVMGTASITIINSDPVLSAHQINPNTGVYLDSVLSCSATVSDLDEVLVADISWYVNGVLLETASGIDLSTHAISVGDSVVCHAQAEDSSGVVVQSDVSVLVENRLPVVDSVSLSPTPAYTNTILTVSATGSDVDQESVNLSYDWYVNGILVQSGTDSTLDGSVHFEKGDSVFVRVYPSDPHGMGAPQDSSSMVIENTPPTDPVIAFVDSAGNEITGHINTNEDVLCSITTPATDIDGDTLSYSFSWEENGNTWQGSTLSVQYADDGISTTDTQTGDQWSCFVSAFDGQEASALASVSIDIGAQFVWEEVGAETVEFAYGSCSSTSSNTTTCSANLVGTKIYMHATEYMGSKRLEYKVLNQTNHYGSVLMDVPGARGYAVSLSADETQITWTGAVSCGGDSIVSRTATVYECVEY